MSYLIRKIFSNWYLMTLYSYMCWTSRAKSSPVSFTQLSLKRVPGRTRGHRYIFSPVFSTRWVGGSNLMISATQKSSIFSFSCRRSIWYLVKSVPGTCTISTRELGMRHLRFLLVVLFVSMMTGVTDGGTKSCKKRGGQCVADSEVSRR